MAKKKVEEGLDWRETYYKTGMYQIDGLYGGDGLPAGSMTEITSTAGIGKTTIALEMCRNLMQADPDFKVLYIDVEDGLNYKLLKSIGIEPFIGKIEDGAQFEIVQWDTHADIDAMLFREKKESKGGRMIACKEEEKGYIVKWHDLIKLVIIDSITAVLPKVAYEKGIENIRPGLKAAYDSVFILKFRNLIRKRYGIASWWVNQKRNKFNFTGNTRLESAGGKAFEHYMDVRLDMYQTNKIERPKRTFTGEEDLKIGSINDIHAFKNKYASGFVHYEIPLIFGKGVSQVLGLKSMLITTGAVTQRGAWYFCELFAESEAKPESMNGEKAYIEWIKLHLADLKIVVDEWVDEFWAVEKKKEAKKKVDKEAVDEGEFILAEPDPVEEE